MSSTLELGVVSKSKTVLTLGWTPPAGVEWYTFFEAGERVSNAAPIDKKGVVKNTAAFTSDPSKQPLEVVAITRDASGSYAVVSGSYSAAPPPPVDPPPPVSDPVAWVVAPPSSGGQVITNPAGVGWMAADTRAAQNALDITIVGGGDSAFMFGAKRGDDTPRLVQRCVATNIAGGNAVSYGKHGIYGDATIDVQDFQATPSKAAASGISFRWAGQNRVRRAILGTQANPFPLPISFYDSGEGFGSTDIDQVILWASLDTAIWASTNPDFGGKVVQQYFVIGPQVEAHVAGGSLLFNAELWDPKSTVTVSRRATVNGKPATVASIGGVPAASLKWVD